MPPRLRRSPARRRAPSPEPSPQPTTDSADAADATEAAVLKIVEDSLQRNAMGPSRDESQGGRFTTRGMLRRDAMQPFLADVRRRVRTELAMLRPRRIATGRGRAAAAAQRVGRRAQVVREQLSRRREILARGIRRKITGAEETRVRDYVRDILEEPPVVRLRDKMSFLLGVVGCFIVEAVALKAPQQFWICYTICMLPLLALRGYLYKRINQHYFLIDFCYASNASCLVQLLAYPTSSRLFQANFLLTTGPLAMAVPTWRNSLVFHSLDRVTSSYIHTLPPLLTFCLRWFPPPALDVNDDLPFVEAFFGAMLFYCAWQGFYLLHTEWLFPPATQLDTSIRVLASGKKDTPPPACYSGITGLTYRAMATIGVMRHAERFDSEHWKTKTIFVGAQLLYTAATLLLAYGLWSSFRAHLAYLLAILACCVWNGGSYYIEVFSKAYRRQFEGDAVTRRRLQLELLVNGNLPDVPEGQCATPEKGAAPMASGAAANDGVAEGGGSADGDAAASDDDHLKNE